MPPVHDYVIDNSTGANVRQDINNALSAIVSNNSNSSEPSTKYAYQWWADTSNALLKIRNSSNDGWLTLFTLTGGVDVDAASNFNEDVTFTGASANIVFDKSDNALEFNDNAKATFGTDVDLSISHDGTTFQIFGTGAGKATVQIEGEGGADPTINFLANNTQHFSIGIDDSDSDKFKISKHSALGTNDYFTLDTSGNIDVTGNFNLPDNAELRLGSDATNGDLQIYHNGTHNYIDTDTNKIHIRVNANENAIVANSNGSVEIYNDGSLRLESQSAGVEITGKLTFATEGLANGSIDLGIDADLNLYHDNSDAFMDNNTGDFYIRNSGANPNQIYIQGKGGENGITVNGNGAVQIYHDHSETLVTTASGISVTGAVYSSTGVFGEGTSNNIDFTTDNRMGIHINGSEEFRFESDGDFHADGDVIAFSTTVSSDEKLKENIQVVPDALKKVEALKGVTFAWKKNNSKSAGVIAQDVMGVLPEAVKEVQGLNDKESYLSVNYNAITSILIEAVKDLSARIKILEAK